MATWNGQLNNLLPTIISNGQSMIGKPVAGYLNDIGRQGVQNATINDLVLPQIGGMANSIGQGITDTLGAGVNLMKPAVGNTSSANPFISATRQKQLASQTPLEQLVDKAGSAANMGGVALGLGLKPKTTPQVQNPASNTKYMPQNYDAANPSNMAEVAQGWSPGLKSKFDQALMSNDSNAVKQMLPDVPDYYKTKFSNEINNAIAGKDAFAQPEAVKQNGFLGSQSGKVDFNAKIGGEDKPAEEGFPTKDYEGNNTWSKYIRDEKTDSIIENPNYEAGSQTPTQYAQKGPEYPPIEGQDKELFTTTPTPPKPQVVKLEVKDQPELTSSQQKMFEKTGLSKYQLPSSYGDKRVPLENTDKSVMANIVGGKSPEEVLGKLPAAEQKVWQQVVDKAAKAPDVSVDQSLMPHIDNQLQKLVDQGYINPVQFREISQAEKLNILGRTADGGLNPNETIPGSRLIDLQKGANGKAPGFISENAPIKQRINAAIAQGYRDAIGNMNPDIRYLYNQYSSMKRIGEMSDKFRNTAGLPPTFLDRLKQNPALTIGAGALALPPIIAGARQFLPSVAGAAGAVAGVAKVAQNTGNNMSTHILDSSIPQDSKGHAQLPSNPANITLLTPGTPEYIQANNALPGGTRQFMVNAPQYMDTANSVGDDVKAGLPLDILTLFKTSQDIQAYMSDSTKPYAKQLSDIGNLNSKFLSAYQSINGTKPDDRQMLSPGDSAAQFQQKYDQMVKFIYDNYAQYQVPYLQTTESPSNPNYSGGGTVPYNVGPTQSNWGAMQQGSIPALNLPPIQ